MGNAEVKILNRKELFDENGKLILHNNTNLNLKNNTKQSENKTYKIRGLQVVKEYLEKWGLIINETCNENEINLNINANTETKNQAKNIRVIDETVKKLCKQYPVYRNQKDLLFALLLDIYPEFTRQYASPFFEKWISNGRIKKDIENLLCISGIDGLFHTDGITEETDKKIDEFVSDLIKSL